MPDCVLAMKFSWSLILAQKINEAEVARGPALGGRGPARDFGGPIMLKADDPCPTHVVYVDNVGILGIVRKRVAEALDQAEVGLNSVGLLTHEKELFAEAADVLGVEVDVKNHRARLMEKGYWRLERGLQWPLNQRSVSGETLSRFVGHCSCQPRHRSH